MIYTDACLPDQVELVAAKKHHLLVLNFAEALGEIMKSYSQRIAISGTNGKSTTTALAGLLLEGAGYDPTVFVGSRVSSFDGNLRVGGKEYFVAEADEYRNHFHQLDPSILTITNIEPDHLDFFETPERVTESFAFMVQKLNRSAKLVLNIDDPGLAPIRKLAPSAVTFGFDSKANLHILNHRMAAGQQLFHLQWNGEMLGEFTLHVPGTFNVVNTAGAIATALASGTKPDSFQAVVKSFHGVWRRFELLNPDSQVTVVNDYAHHPTAIRGTLEGAKSFFPGRRIIAIFQPHHHNRLTTLFDGFASAFSLADEVVVSEVYAVLGREEHPSKTSQDLVKAIASGGTAVSYAGTPGDALAKAKTLIQPNDVVIVMGAGDIWTIAEPLAKAYA